MLININNIILTILLSGLMHSSVAKQNTSNISIDDVSELIYTCDPIEAKRNNYHCCLQPDNSDDILLSFVICSFNRADVFADTLDSIFKQTYDFTFEVVFIDDASTDNTLAVINKYQATHKNLFYFRHDKQKGAPSAGNTGISKARGKLIFNIDSDNFFEADNSIQKIVDLHLKYGYEVICFESARIFSNEAKKIGSLNVTSVEKFFVHNPVSFGFADFINNKCQFYWGMTTDCKLFTKKSWESVGGFIEKDGHDTQAFSLKLLFKGYVFHILPNSHYYHRFWESLESKYFNDLSAGTTGLSLKEFFQNYQEYFTKKTFRKLEKCSNSDYYNLHINFYYKNLVSFIPLNLIKNIATAYKYESLNLYKDAYQEYLNIIDSDYPCHSKIYLKALRAAIFSNLEPDQRLVKYYRKIKRI